MPWAEGCAEIPRRKSREFTRRRRFLGRSSFSVFFFFSRLFFFPVFVVFRSSDYLSFLPRGASDEEGLRRRRPPTKKASENELPDLLQASRDVTLPRGPGLYAFEAGRRIGQCARNVGWIRDCMGSAELKKMSGYRILYSGVTVGTTPYVIEYARVMAEKLVSIPFRACERKGVDRGLHNVLLNTRWRNDVLSFDSVSGPLVNLEVMPPPATRGALGWWR